MNSRAALALLALAVLRAGARAQPASSVWVDVNGSEDFEDSEEVEKRYTPELIEELESAKGESLLLYTEFSARASQSFKQFVRIISRLENETKQGLEQGLLENAPSPCRLQFEASLKKARTVAHRTAAYSGENHHKFFLGHMIVFRMHLNKSEEFVKKSEIAVSNCGVACETQPQIIRWRKKAKSELDRVWDDISDSRRMYRDFLTHAQRKLHSERRRARIAAKAAVAELNKCVRHSG